MSFLDRLRGGSHTKALRGFEPVVKVINGLEAQIQALSDAELKAKTAEFRKRLGVGNAGISNVDAVVKLSGDLSINTDNEVGDSATQELRKAGKQLDSAEAKLLEAEERKRLETRLKEILPEAFAVVREAARRTLGQRHFDVQLLGGMVLNSGSIAEMRTGEGKTLVATLPAYLNALTGKGVHIVTVNDYLSRRDAVWMGQIYNFLGLSVGVINHESSFLYDASESGTEEGVVIPAPDRSRGQAPAGIQGNTTDNIPNNTNRAESKSSSKTLDSRFRGNDTASGNDKMSGNDNNDPLDKERDSLGAFKVVHEFLRPVSRHEAYMADITYGTNNEFGFDYLRDNLEYSADKLRQRAFNYAIVDEIDSILIDEARTPLIISAPTRDAEGTYRQFASLVTSFKKEEDYIVEEKHRSISLTPAGITKAEKALGIDNIYTDKGIKSVHHLETAIKATALYQKDKEYVVKDNQIIIVDEFTGRLQPGRRWSDGLHQAIEAKEGVSIQQESRTYASITFQNFFRMYPKLSGMTGTAVTSAEEFFKVYGLEVTTVPTNVLAVRKDENDQIFRTEIGKYKAIARKVKELHGRGQPVLIGTVSIEKNEVLSQFLRAEGIPHEVLNAKNHEREGEIVAQAGQKGAVTIATNMAGRGVDIKLGGNPNTPALYEEVKKNGGLFVLGTERHEARRIDNQLRGRSGRQGDPGETQFFVSLEDTLMRVFASDMLKSMMGKLGMPEDEAIEHRIISRALETAQEKIEGFNFDARKHVLEFDDIINHQRTAIYGRRRKLLMGSMDDVEGELNTIIEAGVFRGEASVGGFNSGNNVGSVSFPRRRESSVEPLGNVSDDTNRAGSRVFGNTLDSRWSLSSGRTVNDSGRGIDTNADTEERDEVAEIKEIVQKKMTEYGREPFLSAVRIILLQTVDMYWVEHLEVMDYTRSSVNLRAYGQRDPLVEYKKEGLRLFKEMQGAMRAQVVKMLPHVVPVVDGKPVVGNGGNGGGASGANGGGADGVGGANGSANGRGGVGGSVSGFANSVATRNLGIQAELKEVHENAQIIGAGDGSGDSTNSATSKKEEIGRNDPCPCGSGKKYKRCHGNV